MNDREMSTNRWKTRVKNNLCKNVSPFVAMILTSTAPQSEIAPSTFLSEENPRRQRSISKLFNSGAVANTARESRIKSSNNLPLRSNDVGSKQFPTTIDRVISEHAVNKVFISAWWPVNGVETRGESGPNTAPTFSTCLFFRDPLFLPPLSLYLSLFWYVPFVSRLGILRGTLAPSASAKTGPRFVAFRGSSAADQLQQVQKFRRIPPHRSASARFFLPSVMVQVSYFALDCPFVLERTSYLTNERIFLG